MSSLDISNNVVIVKLGGSSITEKGQYETVNDQALKWVAQTLASTTDSEFVFHSNGLSTISRGDTANAKCSFIVVHGAGSFGHMSAKQYGLQGKTVPPSQSDQFRDGCIVQENGSFIQDPDDIRQRTFHGLAKTRASVQKLNNIVVSYLIDAGINAVGLSPGISYPNLQAHGGNEQEGVTTLVLAIKQALGAGLIPVLHGDAGLYGDFTNGRRSMGAGILSGDTLLEVIATHELMKPHLSRAIFLTDVEGVYSRDPKLYNDVQLLKVIEIDKLSGRVITDVLVTGSTHEHDVTGGLTLKLGSAAAIAKSGVEVIIVKCQSTSAEQSLGGYQPDLGTLIRVHGRF